MVVHDRLSLKNDRLLKNGGNCFPIFYTVIVKMRGEEMQVEIKIDVSCKEPKIVVVTDRMTDEINGIVQKLSAEHQTTIIGFKDDVAEILEPSDVYRVFAFNGKVLADTNRGEYSLRLRLYEIEQRLDNHVFVRISNSEIINLKNVKSFDLSFAGTICVTLSNGMVTYVSRRYVAKIKQVLGI